MKLLRTSCWSNLHAATRVCMLAVILAILLWQSRYEWSVHDPMYGWPMPFVHLWYAGYNEQSFTVLLLDFIVWLAIVGATGYTMEYQSQKKSWSQFSLGGLFTLQAIVGVLFVFMYLESWLRAHPNNDSLFPKYANVNSGSVSIWFDIGLFTDPPDYWPVTRLVLMLGIACTAFAAMRLSGQLFRKIQAFVFRKKNAGKHSTEESAVLHEEVEAYDSLTTQHDPLIVRVLLWILFIFAFLLAAGTVILPLTA